MLQILFLSLTGVHQLTLNSGAKHFQAFWQDEEAAKEEGFLGNDIPTKPGPVSPSPSCHHAAEESNENYRGWVGLQNFWRRQSLRTKRALNKGWVT